MFNRETNSFILDIQVDEDFAVGLFGELARAYLAAVNTRSQVIIIHFVKLSI